MSYILYPFAWLLLFLYNLFKSYGLALILFALIIKLVLLYFSMKSKKGTMKTARLQPKAKELEKRYAGNKAKYNEEVQKLYKENDVKMMGGCVWSLIPFPILIGLYSVIRDPLTYLMRLSKPQIETVSGILSGLGCETATGTYQQITMAQQIFQNFDAVKASVPEVLKLDFSFLGLNLAETPQWKIWEQPLSWQTVGLFLIPIISALLSLLSSKISMIGTDTTQQSSMKGMMLMAPLMSLWIGFIMPAGLGIYWIATSVFTMLQDFVLAKHYTKVLDAEDAVRIGRLKAAEEARELKRVEYERLKAENATTRNKNTSKKKVQKVERADTEKKDVEKTNSGAEKKRPALPIDSDRPFARGRAYNSDRVVETAPVLSEKELAEKAKLAAEQEAAEAARKDEEDFEKFLATGKIDDGSENTEAEAEIEADAETEAADADAESVEDGEGAGGAADEK